MGPVSIYRVGAVGADPVHVFGGEAHDFDLWHAVWLGWLPLTLVGFAGPGVALAGDTWLTAPLGRSEGPRHAAAGDIVTARDAAGEVIARRERGLTAYTNCSGDVSSDGLLWASSVALSVADDLVANIDRLRSAQATLAEWVDGVERERAVLDACQSSPSGESPVLRSCGRAARDLQEEQLRLHLLLDAAVRIGVFDPAVAASRKPRRVRSPRVSMFHGDEDERSDRRPSAEGALRAPAGLRIPRMCRGGVPVSPLVSSFACSRCRPLLLPFRFLDRWCRLPTPIVNAIPMALQSSSSARSMFGLCPLKSARNASSGRPVSVAARLGPQPSRFSCACTRSASRRLAGPVGFLFIRVFPSVLDVVVVGRAVARRSHGPSTIPCRRRARALGRRQPSRNAAGRVALVRRVPVSLHGGTSRLAVFGIARRRVCPCVLARRLSILLAATCGLLVRSSHRPRNFPVAACSPSESDARARWTRGAAE